MAETTKSRGNFWGWMAGAIGLISGVLGIVVFVNDEVRARVFPDLAPATKADVQEQMQLSEDRIASVVQASIATALASAQSRGTEVSADEKANYEAALTSLLASEDPTFNDAKFLAVTGQPEAAAQNLVTLAEQTSGPAEDNIPEKDRATLLRSAGDILVPSDPVKALAAYKKAQELDPDNPILATRIQQLSAQTAEKNTATAVPNAKFEFDGLLFEFEGCETDKTLKCVLSVTNSTPDTKELFMRSIWAVDEHSRWLEDTQVNVRASSHYTWNVPSLEASQIDISFGKPANILQYLYFDIHVDNVSYSKTFRDLAVRGGKNVEVRKMRDIDPDHPERAFSFSGVDFHFLGCSNPDAPICRFDVTNNSNATVVLNTNDSTAYDQSSVLRKSLLPTIDISRDNRGEIPTGVTTGWDVNFRTPASYFQEFRASFQVDGQRVVRTFRNLPLSDGAEANVKTLDPAAAVAPDGYFEVDGVEFAFMGCTNPIRPVCRTDVRNNTDKEISVAAHRASATYNGGEELNTGFGVIEMTGDRSADLPPGMTTTYINTFPTEVEVFEALNLGFTANDQSIERTFALLPVE